VFRACQLVHAQVVSIGFVEYTVVVYELAFVWKVITDMALFSTRSQVT